jgi:hypothetical protein
MSLSLASDGNNIGPTVFGIKRKSRAILGRSCNSSYRTPCPSARPLVSDHPETNGDQTYRDSRVLFSQARVGARPDSRFRAGRPDRGLQRFRCGRLNVIPRGPRFAQMLGVVAGDRPSRVPTSPPSNGRRKRSWPGLAAERRCHKLMSKRAFPAAGSPSRLPGEERKLSDAAHRAARMPRVGTGPLLDAHAWSTTDGHLYVGRTGTRDDPGRLRSATGRCLSPAS